MQYLHLWVSCYENRLETLNCPKHIHLGTETDSGAQDNFLTTLSNEVGVSLKADHICCSGPSKTFPCFAATSNENTDGHWRSQRAFQGWIPSWDLFSKENNKKVGFGEGKQAGNRRKDIRNIKVNQKQPRDPCTQH